jgi:1,2-diacylglycerol 3-alpha-glucosyltransferase
MTNRPVVALVVEYVPPWLIANFNGCANYVDLNLIELTPPPPKFATPGPALKFRRYQAPSNSPAFSTRDTFRYICDAFDNIKPDAVLTIGWTGPQNLAALLWAVNSGTPVITASETNEMDFERIAIRERLKKVIVSMFNCIWATGSRAAAYAEKLGIPQERIVTGQVDIVDTDHFIAGTAEARQAPDKLREELALPRDYFLSVSRLAPEKNVVGLVRSYGEYRTRAGADAWDLVLVGDGPTRDEVEREVDKLAIGANVQLRGWKEFSELPAYYALAKAFVLASTREPWGAVVNEAATAGLPLLVSERCGSAPELVIEGRNGFTFDPCSTTQLADCMWRLSHGTCDLSSMGEVSREISKGWTPERHGQNLANAVRVALNSEKRKISLTQRVALRLLLEVQFWTIGAFISGR